MSWWRVQPNSDIAGITLWSLRCDICGEGRIGLAAPEYPPEPTDKLSRIIAEAFGDHREPPLQAARRARIYRRRLRASWRPKWWIKLYALANGWKYSKEKGWDCPEHHREGPAVFNIKDKEEFRRCLAEIREKEQLRERVDRCISCGRALTKRECKCFGHECEPCHDIWVFEMRRRFRIPQLY